MPDGATESLRPGPNFREYGRSDSRADERAAPRLGAQIAGLFAEHQELRRLVTAAQAAVRTARDETLALRA